MACVEEEQDLSGEAFFLFFFCCLCLTIAKREQRSKKKACRKKQHTWKCKRLELRNQIAVDLQSDGNSERGGTPRKLWAFLLESSTFFLCLKIPCINFRQNEPLLSFRNQEGKGNNDNRSSFGFRRWNMTDTQRNAIMEYRRDGLGIRRYVSGINQPI